MKTPKITAIIPCRKGSQRVAHKNTRPFAHFGHGLLELKLKQLDAATQIDEILVTTNDPVVIGIVAQLAQTLSKPLILDERPDQYAADDSLQGLIGYLCETVKTDVIAWTHVTSPLFDATLYDAAITAYLHAQQNLSADSLMAVDAVQTFAMRSGAWISHDSSVKRWPRTQDLEKIFLVNSALFVIALPLMTVLQDRVGLHPQLFETPAPQGFDIDWEDDFSIGEKLYRALLNRAEDGFPKATSKRLIENGVNPVYASA